MDNIKELAAIERITKYGALFPIDKMFCGHSGGKDSCVILDLVQRVWGDIKIVHNVKPLLGTSGDPIAALTEQHPKTLNFLYTKVCKDNEVVFMHSSKMEEWINKNDMMCQFDGARKAEFNRPGKSSNIIRNGQSVNRSLMNEFESCGIFGLSLIYPILDWEDKDVFDYLDKYKIEFSEEYLDNGEFAAWQTSF